MHSWKLLLSLTRLSGRQTHPNLITAWFELIRDGAVIDRTDERCGFRTVSTHGNRLRLNGEPI